MIPAYGWGAGEHVHEPLIQSTLTVTTADLKIGYDLATEYGGWSQDGLTWTVNIRDDVNFTDGEKLTARDVAFYIQYPAGYQQLCQRLYHVREC